MTAISGALVCCVIPIEYAHGGESPSAMTCITVHPYFTISSRVRSSPLRRMCGLTIKVTGACQRPPKDGRADTRPIERNVRTHNFPPAHNECRLRDSERRPYTAG